METHAHMGITTHAHGNNKNEYRQRNRGLEESSEHGKKKTWHKKLYKKNRTLLVYRYTRITAADDTFYASLDEILLTSHDCVIMGDFNIPHIEWSIQ